MANKTLSFTNRALKALPPQAAEAGANADTYSDAAVPGLKLEVTKRGKKTFVFRFRLYGAAGYARIGEFPATSVEEARKRALEMRATVDRGFDPRHETMRRREMPTFSEFALGDYLPYASSAGKRSVKDDESKLRNHLVPRFGDRRLDAICRRDIEQYHAQVKASHTPATANRHLALLRAIYRRALEWERVDRSPCDGVKAFPEHNASERFLSEAEIGRLKAAMDADTNRVAAAALMLLLLTGARRGEVSALEWAHLDLDRGIWYLDGSRTKSGRGRTITLSGAALDLLNAQPSKGVSPWVFPGREGDKPVNNLTKPFNRMLATAGVAKARVHDLRHTHASQLAASGVPLLTIRDALGHASMQMTTRYAHLADQTRRDASEVMARIVAGA